MLTKLKYGAINNKKIILFLFSLCIIGILSSSILVTVLSKVEQNEIINYIKNYFGTLNKIDILNTFVNSFINNIIPILFIWIIGISIIGVPIIIFIYFYKMFILGFTISSFILTYKIKGLLLSFLYVFPSKIISILIYTLICLYAIKISNNLIYIIFNKKDINCNKITRKYIKILIISSLLVIFNSIYESIILKILFNKVIVLLKI